MVPESEWPGAAICGARPGHLTTRRCLSTDALGALTLILLSAARGPAITIDRAAGRAARARATARCHSAATHLTVGVRAVIGLIAHARRPPIPVALALVEVVPLNVGRARIVPV